MNCYNSTVIVFYFFNKYALYSENEVIASNTVKCVGSDTMVMPTKLLKNVSNKQYFIGYFCQCFQGSLLNLKSYTSLKNES